MYKVRTYNAIAAAGLQRFAADKYTVGPEVEAPEALLLRSHKLTLDELSDGL